MPPDVLAFVRAVAERVPVAIGSGAVREEIVHVLDQHGLRDLFGVLGLHRRRRARQARSRDLPALPGRAAPGSIPELGPEDCLVFEDSRFGIAAAHAAGMRCVAVHTSGELVGLAAADLVVQGLTGELALGLFGTEVQ